MHFFSSLDFSFILSCLYFFTGAQNIQIINQNQIQVPEGCLSPRGGKNGNIFHPSFYMGLLGEGNIPKGTKAYSEKDLGSSMESIIKGKLRVLL